MIKLTWNYHCHTNYTDGLHTVEEIAKYCNEHGVEELAICEHVKRELTYDFDQLLSDIKLANLRSRVNIFTGVEAKILPDGTLDCPEEIKKKVDIVIGSVHSLDGMTEQEAYERLATSDCMIIGHPQFVNDNVIASLIKTGKIVELSNRYEQSEDMIKAFRDAGLLFSIGLDSHRLEDFNDFGKLAEVIERLGLQERLWRFPHGRSSITSQES
jgi:histidinol phosphatase-like PHP family hydrolase